MHQTRIRRAYYRIFRVANTPDLGMTTPVPHYSLLYLKHAIRASFSENFPTIPMLVLSEIVKIGPASNHNVPYPTIRKKRDPFLPGLCGRQRPLALVF